MKKIIKGSFTDIKLAKGLNISNATQTIRKGETGVSTKSYGKVWFHLYKGKAIFKSYDAYQSEIKNIRIVNELLCYELAKQMGIRCAEYELATFGKTTGLVTYQVNKPNERLIDSREFFKELGFMPTQNLDIYSIAIDEYIKQGYKINKQKMLKDLFKISLFDSLTMQSDRNSANVFFLVNKNQKSIKVAPLIDNEFAFNSQNLNRRFDNNEKISRELFIENLNYIYKIITMDDSNAEDSLYLKNLKLIVSIVNYDEEFAKIFKNFMKGFNVEKAIKKVNDKGIKISPKYEKFLLMSEDVVKEIYHKELNPYKSQNQTTSLDNEKSL